ncbi:MAG: ChbG/HpnK family deacetylase [Bacillota bacterium]
MDLWHLMGLDGRRAIIIHQDDLGVTEAQARAYRQLGFPTASVMLPGPWAPLIREGDLGVHITLTSEWPSPRLRPLTAGESLRDPHGYFPSTVADAWMQMRLPEAAAEMRAQIEAALALGIDVTHIDTHMGAVVRPDIAQAYHDLAMEYRLPALFPDRKSYDRLPATFREELIALCEASPLPKVQLVDGYYIPAAERRDWYLDTLSRLGPGVYHLIHHAAAPTAEGRALLDWEGRKADLEALLDPEVRRVLGEFALLTYREVRDGMRRYL